ncbi:MAG: aminotransferase class V-fold PLP-dependent enzyme [Fimbriimonadaceae bacterium]
MTTPLTPQEIQTQIAPLFSRHNPKGIYLANHSLGRPLDATQDRINEYLNHWYEDLDDAWTPWLATLETYHSKVKSLLRIPESGSVVLKTSAGLALRAVLNCFSDKTLTIVTSSQEFDSIDFILRTYESKNLAQVTYVEPEIPNPVPLFNADRFIAEITSETDLVILSVVNFTTGQLFPNLDQVIDHAHKNNALVVLDTYHSFGVIDHPWPNADFAIGGSYKYVHGGPGSCWLAINNQENLQTLDTGWFAKKELFGYERNADRATDHRAWWESTPPVIQAYQALAGLEYLENFTVEKLRATNLARQAEMRDIFRQHNIPIYEPKDPHHFGAFSLLPAENHKEIVTFLKDQNIRVDSRNGFVRFGPHPLNITEEFQAVAETLRESGLILTV